jgi:hypothetical protein
LAGCGPFFISGIRSRTLTLALSQRERELISVVLTSYADLKYPVELRI